jgi:hypothetical protein
MGINKGHHEYKAPEKENDDNINNNNKEEEDDEDDNVWINVNPLNKINGMIDLLKEIPSLSVKELKKRIELLHGEHSSCIEKRDMKKILINLTCKELSIKELFEVINVFFDNDKISNNVLDNCIKNNNKQFLIDLLMKSYNI